MARYAYKGERTWVDWLRLGIEVLFATLIFSIWFSLAIASKTWILTALFTILTAGTFLVAGRLTYLEAKGANYTLSDNALRIRAKWFIEDLDVQYAEISDVLPVNGKPAWPNIYFVREVDASEGEPRIYIGWPSKRGLVEIRLDVTRTAKYKLPQDFDIRDILQALPWGWRRVSKSFDRIIISVEDRDLFIEALRKRIVKLEKPIETQTEEPGSLAETLA